MKTETIVLGLVAVAGIAAGYYYYQAHKNTLATTPAVNNGNANQRSNTQGNTNDTVAYVNAGVDALDKLGQAFGGW